MRPLLALLLCAMPAFAQEDSGEARESFQLDRVLIGSVTSHDRKLAVLLALVDARKQKLVARQSLLLTADGTDENQLELETSNAGRKIVAQDSGVVEAGAPAASDEDLGLASHERKVALPAAGVAAESARAAAGAGPPSTTDKPAPASTEQNKKKKKESRGLKGKSGTEGWDDEESP